MKKSRKGFIKNLHYFCLICVIALGLMTIVGTGGGGGSDPPPIPPPLPCSPTPGTWTGPADFGEIEFVVTQDGTEIEQIEIVFVDFTCGITTTNVTYTFISTWPITNGQFTADFTLGGGNEITIQGTFDGNCTNVTGTYEADFDGTICQGTWDASPPSCSPTPGTWTGPADFGEIEFVVTQDGTEIEQIEIVFIDFTCGITTVNGSITITSTWPITNGQFTADLTLGGGNEMTIQGTFDGNCTNVTGTYEADFDGTICQGTWDASP
jgi:hypothetical protein